MKQKISTYSCLVVLVALLSGCSAPEEDAGSSNTNATPPANSNAASQPLVAQSTPNAAPSVQPAPILPSLGQPPAAANANVSFAPVVGVNNARAPKLMVASKKIDFGKQPQDKTLVRVIAVRNGGQADLKIESVVPS